MNTAVGEPRLLDLADYTLDLPPCSVSLLLNYYGKEELQKLIKSLTIPPKSIAVRACNGLSAKELGERIQKHVSESEGAVSIHDELKEAVIVKSRSRKSSQIFSKLVLVTRACGESVLRGSNVYIPGIVTCSAGINAGDTVSICVDVDEVVRRGGSNIRDGGRLVHIASGKATVGKRALCSETNGIGVQVLDSALPWKLPPLNTVLPPHQSYGQSIPAMIVSHVLVNSLSNETTQPKVLDMCAAPGGKTSHIAQLLRGRGIVVACERSLKRAQKLEETCSILSDIDCKCVVPLHLDITKSVISADGGDSQLKKTVNEGASRRKQWKENKRRYFAELSQTRKAEKVKLAESADMLYQGLITKEEYEQRKNESKARIAHFIATYDQSGIIPEIRHRASSIILTQSSTVNDLLTLGVSLSVKNRLNIIQGFEQETFDAILLDGPCSALGLRPRIGVDEHKSKGSSLLSMANYQRKLIDIAVRLLKPGGTLVYSTCTINPLENECNVAYALQKHKSLSLEEQVPYLGQPGVSGAGLSEAERNLVQWFNPAHEMDTCGFFCAKFSKSMR
mmetsp:Transcript_6013/g.6881  ORF Transcript_6013/g.6881 Transcript_6013/m.6881 type:complete len:564 (-) Transcript_6013:212-1903(-)